MADREERDWVRGLGTALVIIGVGMWGVYAIGKYLFGWQVTDRDFLPYHLAVILPGMVLRYHRFFFEDIWRHVCAGQGESQGAASKALTGEERDASMQTMIIINNFLHDMATGLWTSSVLVIYLLQKKAMGLNGMLISPILHDVMRFFFWLGIVSLMVILFTGVLRLLYYRRENAEDSGETKKNILIVKHVFFAVVFIGGTYIAYLYAFKY